MFFGYFALLSEFSGQFTMFTLLNLPQKGRFSLSFCDFCCLVHESTGYSEWCRVKEELIKEARRLSEEHWISQAGASVAKTKHSKPARS